MSEINPYESPRSPEPAVVAELAEPESGGVWQHGSVLVMHKRATLPDRCVKSNQPAHGRKLKRDLYWHHPWIYLTILISLLIYVIVAVIVRKRALIHIGLSERWFARRRRAILIGWGSGLLAMLIVGLGIALVDTNPGAGLLMVMGILVFLVGVIYGVVASRMVAPTRITDDYVWLKGVHRDFLAELPHWPYAG